MDSKTLATIMIVIVCILLFPLIIGAIGAIVGVFASIAGGIFGIFAGLFGAIFGAIGAIFGAIFGAFGWIFDHDYHGRWPFHFFDGDFFTAVLLVLVIVLLARSRRNATARK